MAPSAILEVSPSSLAPKVKTQQPTHDDVVRTGLEKTPLEAICHGTPLPGIPTFPTFVEERKHILTHMAATFRLFARQGFTEGASGHISVRDPEFEHLMWMNPLGRHFGCLTAGDMICVDIGTGKLAGGNLSRPANAAGVLIHSAVHRRRPHDIHAICHAHTIAGRSWSVFARPLEMLSQDICNFHNAHAVYADYGGIVFGAEEGERIAEALGEHNKGAILMNHGLITVGETVDEAGFMFGLLDRGCQMQLQVEAAAAAGLKKNIISDEEAAYNYRMASDKDSLYMEAQSDLEFEFMMAGGEEVIARGFDLLSPLIP